jgi:tRNA A-37 threonylcarbamoyl transferase component Bud32
MIERPHPREQMIETGKFLQQRYKIDKQIGQGGMGAVYVATDERFGSRVAIKETLFMDDNFRKAIEREARLLNSLKHFALPRVTDHFEEDNGQFLVMEYIAGEDVAAILEREKRPFSSEQVLKWADQLLDALDYLHNQAIPVVHRDIKPQNIKITPKGDVILLDFGLAKGNPTDASANTAAKSIFGYSRNYASLEQIQGTGTDPRSDLYSLAATLYHLLTNVAPEDALTRAMSVLSQKGDTLLPANIVEPSVPRGIAGVLQKAMDLNAAGRPASAAEMREMLRSADKYADVTENFQAAVTVPAAFAFAQDTRLMPEGTNAMPGRQEMKTEVLPAYDSQETRVNSAAALAATTDAGGKRGGMGFLAGAGAVLVLACVAVGGVYLVKPSLFGSSTTGQPVTPPVTVEPNAAANVAVPPAGVSSNTGVVAPLPPITQTAQTSKSSTGAETAKNKKPADTKGGGDDTAIDVPDVDSDPSSGVVTIRKKNPDGSVTSTQVGPGTPIPPRDYNPFPNGVPDFQNMTPAQRKRMQEVMRRNVRRQIQNERNQPQPQGTP